MTWRWYVRLGKPLAALAPLLLAASLAACAAVPSVPLLAPTATPLVTATRPPDTAPPFVDLTLAPSPAPQAPATPVASAPAVSPSPPLTAPTPALTPASPGTGIPINGGGSRLTPSTPALTVTPTSTRTATATPSVTPTPTPTLARAARLAREMAAAINRERARSPAITPQGSQGLPPAQPAPLDWDDRLAAVAEAHARDMVARAYFDHRNPDGQQPIDRVRDAAIHFVDSLVTENIYQARGEDALQQAMDWFMQDPLHRDTILDPRTNRVGVGVHEDGERVYFVQLFIVAP